jgi:hypothetical protein
MARFTQTTKMPNPFRARALAPVSMDVLDAGVYVSKWEADLPGKIQPVLWGPLQAKEMGLEGWEVQDGGETGMVYHRAHARVAAGFATATLIVVNRLKKAFVTVYLGGYPADVDETLRRSEAQRLVNAAQTFLARLAKQPVQFRFQGELALVDNINDAKAIEAQARQAEGAGALAGRADVGRMLGGGRLPGKRPSGPVEEV